MQHIFHSLKKALKKKSYDHQLVARLLLNELTTVLGDGRILQWHLKRSMLYIHHNDHQFAIQLFSKKRDILTKLNEKLTSLWYDLVLKDMRVVPQRDAVQRQEEWEEPYYGIEEEDL